MHARAHQPKSPSTRLLTRREAIGALAATTAVVLTGCTAPANQGTSSAAAGAGSDGTRTVRILATSDLHGKMLAWNYPADKEDLAGSMPQLATAIASLRDERTLLVDVGDTIQDNMAELFLEEEVHPMIASLNHLRYDIGVTGNHEYNFGMDVARKAVASFEGKVLTGNVIDEKGDAIAEGYTIIPVDGVRVGVIGMVTPLIARWDESNLKGCTVTSAVDETRKIVDQIKGDVDVLVAALHMGIESEHNNPGTGARDVAEACPEIDVILAAHSHTLVEGERIGNALVVENRYQAQTLCAVDLTFERAGNAWKLVDKTSRAVDVSEFEPDQALTELLAPYDERTKAYAREEVGTLEGGPLAPDDEIPGVPSPLVQDTALLDLINRVQLHYSGADVSVASPFQIGANIHPGTIRRCDVAKAYMFANTLYTLRFTGRQMRTYLEWSAGQFRQWKPGDLTLAFEEDARAYNMVSATGITYKIDVSKEAGARIVDLAWPDGRAVADDDTFVLATSNHTANSFLLKPGTVFSEGDALPELLDMDVRMDIGSIREMMVDYIQNVRGGTITSDVDGSWQLVGNDWDPALHEQVVELVRNGTIVLDERSVTMKFLCTEVATEADLAKATNG